MASGTLKVNPSMQFLNIDNMVFSRGGGSDIVYIEWDNANVKYNIAINPAVGITFNKYDGSSWSQVWTIPKP